MAAQWILLVSLQGLAVLRLDTVPGLDEACTAWMRKHTPLLLPNHILAFLNVRAPPLPHVFP